VGHEIDFTIADFVADLRAPTPSAAAELVVKDKQELQQMLSHYSIRLKNTLRNCLEQNRSTIGYLSRHLIDPAKRIINYQIQCDDLRLRLGKSLPRIVRQRKGDIGHYREVILLHTPRTAIQNYRSTLGYLKKSCINTAEVLLERNSAALKNCCATLNTLNPLNILQRGYSITRLLPAQEIVKSARQVRTGDTVDVRLSEGEVYCIVDKVIL
jgi:exodeoxyribonuclease VII large subunit